LWFVYFDDLQLHQHLVLLSLGSTILCQPNQHCWLDRQHTVLLLPDLPHPPQASQTTLRQVNIKVDCPSLPVPEHTILFGLGVLLCRSCESNERNKMALFFTYCPIPRLPVFIIGILGGMQTLRWRGSLGYQETLPESQENAKTALWKRRTDIGGFLYVFFFLSCTCFNIFGAVTNLFIRWSNGYAQLFIVPLQLTIILGLSRSGNTSILARVCNNNKVQFLGDISMVLYLIHYDQLVYLSMLTSMLSKEDEYTLPTKVFSPSQIFFGLIVFSILLSWILLKTFVNPLAKVIKKCFFKFNQRELKLTERNKHSP